MRTSHWPFARSTQQWLRFDAARRLAATRGQTPESPQGRRRDLRQEVGEVPFLLSLTVMRIKSKRIMQSMAPKELRVQSSNSDASSERGAWQCVWCICEAPS